MKFWIKIASFILIFFTCGQFSLAQEQFQYDSKGKRDPFIPLIGQDVELTEVESLTLEEISLEGVIYDPNTEGLAVINGQVLKEGDFIGGFKLEKIKSKGVILTQEDKIYEVNLVEETESSPPTK